jgi:hypothetical protein
MMLATASDWLLALVCVGATWMIPNRPDVARTDGRRHRV